MCCGKGGGSNEKQFGESRSENKSPNNKKTELFNQVVAVEKEGTKDQCQSKLSMKQALKEVLILNSLQEQIKKLW